MRVSPPAKINLCLRVLGRRPDGFHEIDSLFVKIDFFDELEITPRPDAAIELVMTTPFPGIPDGPSNLAWKAARLFSDAVPGIGGVTLRLDKRIPPGGGLGGGSSDAAHVLMGMNRLFGAPLGRGELLGLAERLGSDVPFFLSGPAARVQGRGDKVTPVPPPEDGAFLLVFPGVHVSTSWAYGALAKGPLTNTGHRSMLTCSGDLSRPVRQWACDLHNDFEETVFDAFPRLRDVGNELRRQGALGVVMSGSGSTMVGVFDTVETARVAAEPFAHTGAVVARPLAGPPDRIGDVTDGA